MRWAAPETVRAAIDGSLDDIEALILRIWPTCYRLAISIVGDRNLAEDTAQEACAIVHRKVRSLRTVDAFDAWLYRIVMRECTRTRRRFRQQAIRFDEGTVSPQGPEALDVWRALAALPPEQRDVAVLFYFHDLKTVEIAHILRTAHTTIRTRLNRARERLRVLLSNYSTPGRLEQHAF